MPIFVPTKIPPERLGVYLPPEATRDLALAAVQAATDEIIGTVAERAQRVLRSRFGLGGALPKTLHVVGADEGITRERIRQIEQGALRTVRSREAAARWSARTMRVREALAKLSRMLGGVVRVDVLAFLLHMKGDAGHAMLRFLLSTLPEAKEIRNSSRLVGHFRLEGGPSVARVLEEARRILTEAQHPVPDAAVFRGIRHRTSLAIADPAVRSVLSVARDLVRTPFGEWGIRGWREATPRNVGDKSYIVLKHAEKPLHFSDIAERINAAKFDGRAALPQTVHNELIRDDQFVLVGRGLYALRERGHVPGTVAEVLERILRRAGEPLWRDELIAAVLKERIVRRNTILLALQNRERFSRLSDGRYVLARSVARSGASRGEDGRGKPPDGRLGPVTAGDARRSSGDG